MRGSKAVFLLAGVSALWIGSGLGSGFGLAGTARADDTSVACADQSSVSGQAQELALNGVERAIQSGSGDDLGAELKVAAKLGEPGFAVLLAASKTTDAKDANVRSALANLAIDTDSAGNPYLPASESIQLLTNVYPRLSSDDRFFAVSNLASTYKNDSAKGADTLPFYENFAMKDSQVNQKKAALTAVADLGPAALPVFKMGMQDKEPSAGNTCDVHSFAVDLSPSVLGTATLNTLTQQYDTLHGCDQVRASTMGASEGMLSAMIKAGQTPDSQQVQQVQQVLLQGVGDHAADNSPIVRLAAVESAGKLAQDSQVGWGVMSPVLVEALQDPVNENPQTHNGEQILLEAAHAADFAGPAGAAVCKAAMQTSEPQEVQQVGRGGCVTDSN